MSGYTPSAAFSGYPQAAGYPSPAPQRPYSPWAYHANHPVTDARHGEATSYYSSQPSYAGSQSSTHPSSAYGPGYGPEEGERGLGTMAAGAAVGFGANRVTGHKQGGLKSALLGAATAQAGKMLYDHVNNGKKHGGKHGNQHGHGLGYGYSHGHGHGHGHGHQQYGAPQHGMYGSAGQHSHGGYANGAPPHGKHKDGLEAKLGSLMKKF